MSEDLLNGLDLFSGIGGIAEALAPWVRTIAYCENDRYAQAVLLSRMARGEIHTAPIWDDVTTLKGSDLPDIGIISGGFPCQDISIAGRGEGLEGKRSGLFGEIVRLAGELRPQYIFLENVPAITFRGLSAVTRALAELRYDCRWGLLSAFDVGAPHRRERWWLLASNTSGARNGREEKRGIRPPSGQSKRKVANNLGEKRPDGEDVADAQGREPWEQKTRNGREGIVGGGEKGGENVANPHDGRHLHGQAEVEPTERGVDAQRELEPGGADVPHTNEGGLPKARPEQQTAGVARGDTQAEVSDTKSERGERGRSGKQGEQTQCGEGVFGRSGAGKRYDWSTEPDVGRVVNGLPFRSHRLMCLGNSVVPQCAREAFKRLIGL